MVVMANEAGDDTAPATALWDKIVKQLYPGSLPTWS